MGIFGRRSPDITKMQLAGDVEGLVRVLSHTDPAIRRDAAQALSGTSLSSKLSDDKRQAARRSAAAALVPLVADPDPVFRTAIVGALGTICGELAKEALMTATTDPDSAVRTKAVEQLVPSWGDPVIRALVPRLDDTDHNVSAAAVRVLSRAKAHDKAAIDALTNVFAGGVSRRRKNIIDALITLEAPADAFAEAAKDPDADVRTKAERYLSILVWKNTAQSKPVSIRDMTSLMAGLQHPKRDLYMDTLCAVCSRKLRGRSGEGRNVTSAGLDTLARLGYSHGIHRDNRAEYGIGAPDPRAAALARSLSVNWYCERCTTNMKDFVETLVPPYRPGWLHKLEEICTRDDLFLSTIEEMIQDEIEPGLISAAEIGSDQLAELLDELREARVSDITWALQVAQKALPTPALLHAIHEFADVLPVRQGEPSQRFRPHIFGPNLVGWADDRYAIIVRLAAETENALTAK